MSGFLTSALNIGQQIVAGGTGAQGLSLPSMFDMQNLPDIAGNWLWTANITGVPNLPSFNNLLLADINVPFEGFTTDPRFRGGFTYNFPKFINTTPVQLTFHEVQTFIVTNYLQQWKNQIVDPGSTSPSTAGNYSLPKDYYGRMVITLFDTMGIPALEVTLTGVWPERQSDLSLTTTGSGALQVQVSLAINRSNISYCSATLLDSPLAKFISGNPMATLKSLAGNIAASAESTALGALGQALSPVTSGITNAVNTGFNSATSAISNLL